MFPITIVDIDGSERTLSDEESTAFWDALQEANDYLTERDGGGAWREAVTELNATVPGLELDSMGGYVPIQGYGTYQGEPCYFRARHQHASFSVGTYDAGGAVSSWMAKRQAVAKVVPDDDPYGAGYLTPAMCVVVLRDMLVPNLQVKTQSEGEAELKAISDWIDKQAAEKES